MKPAPFEYARPADLDQACAMLAAGDDARIIAGGQTLVPLMAMRLARPKRLIDIARIGDLAFVRHEREAIAIGATTRQCVLERDAVVRAAVPLLAKVMPFVGHAAIRSRGTVGGSLANADPAAEIALVLDADLGSGTSADDVLAATRFAHASLEIIDSRITDWKIGLVDTIADNASSGGLVLGQSPVPVAGGRDLSLAGCVFRRNGRIAGPASNQPRLAAINTVTSPTVV